MMRKRTGKKNHGIWLLLIPLTALLTLAWGAWLHPMILQPHTHHADTACKSCHFAGANSTPGNATMPRAEQEQLCDLCHPSGFIPVSVQNWDGLDQYSIQCLGCHGDKAGVYEETDSIVIASNQILRHGSLNHSIGRSYAAAATYGGYRPIEKLADKIQLPNGVVSCISCHEGSGKNHGKLLTTIRGSALCFECHDL